MGNTSNDVVVSYGFTGPDPARKIKGKLVHLNSEQKISNVQVFLYGVINEEDEAQLIATGSTDKDGNFSLVYPQGCFLNAFIATAISEELIDVVLKEDATLPLFVYGGLMEIDTDKMNDCSCKSNTPRLPDEEDFALTSTYSQDIGGSCTNFTTPNRALEEFSYFSIVRLTDPEVNLSPDAIRARLAIIDAQITQIQTTLKGFKEVSVSEQPTKAAKVPAGSYETATPQTMLSEYNFYSNMLKQLQKERENLLKSGRKEISLISPVNWEDDTIESNQATSLAFGHLLHWKQVWRADGYSLGDLVYSLPLAPGQRKNIAIMDWSRKEVASRSEELSYEESLTNSISRDRDINEIVNSVLTDAMSANSESKIKSSSWSIGASVSVPAGPVSVGVSGGYSSSNSQGSSSAEQNAARDLAAATMQNIRDKSMQSASAVRSQRSTVITTMEQSETMRVETEVLANYNHCHAITIQYFEVLRHFALHTELADVQECIFIPLIMTQFDKEKAAKWKDVLTSYLRVNGRNQFAWYSKGLEACIRETTHATLADAYADLPAGAFSEEAVRSIWGSIKVRVNVTRPTEIHPATPAAWSSLGEGIFQQFIDQALVNNPDDIASWESQLGFIDNWENIRRKVYAVPANKRDALFEQLVSTDDVAQQIMEKMALWLHKYNGNSPTQQFRPKYRLLSVQRSKRDKMNGNKGGLYEFGFTKDIGYGILRREVKAFNIVAINQQSQVLTLPSGSYFTVEDVTIQYKTDHYSNYLVKATGIGDDINNTLGASYEVKLDQAEMRNLRTEFQQAKNDLLRHLNENMEYYHKVLWHNMDADKRLMMLEGFQVEVPGRILPGSTTPEPSEMRSLASVVENKIISIVGNSIVMPVARGYNLNPRFRFDTDTVETADGRKVSKLHSYYMPDGLYKSAPYRISVPTHGVFGEAISGACNSCEKIDDSRYWKWEEHPIPDSPTAINPISMDGRRADVGNLSPSQLSSGLISQSDPLATVDPTGLGKALDLMGKSDVFRDITGLAGNQANALAGLNATQAGAKSAMDNSIAMAKQAADMYKYQQNMKNSDKIADKINNDPNLSPDDKKELMKKHYQNLLGEGNDTAEGDAAGTKKPMDKLVDKAVGSNKGKVTMSNADGESIDMEFEDAEVMEENSNQSFGDLGIPKSETTRVFDETEQVDFNDQSYIDQRNELDDLLTQLQPSVDQFFQSNNNQPIV